MLVSDPACVWDFWDGFALMGQSNSGPRELSKGHLTTGKRPSLGGLPWVDRGDQLGGKEFYGHLIDIFKDTS